jgi:hypothetical protein
MTVRGRWLAGLALALVLAGCGGGEAPPTTPTSPPAGGGGGGGGGGRDSGVEVQREAFPAGGGSGIVASKRYPGVLWAIRDRGGQDRQGRPQNALYAYKVTDGKVAKLAGGAAFKAVPMPVPAGDGEDIGRDSEGNLWIADIGNNECDRTDTALLKVREPDPAATGPAKLLATYRYRFPDPPAGCAGRNAESMFLVDDVPYLIDKAEESTLYRFPSLDPDAAVTLEKVGVLAGQVANLSGADLSTGRRPGPSSSPAPAPARPTSRGWRSATTASTSTSWPRTATPTSSRPAPTSAEAGRPPAPSGRAGARGGASRAGGPPTAAGPRRRGRRPAGPRVAGHRPRCRPGPTWPGTRPG